MKVKEIVVGKGELEGSISALANGSGEFFVIDRNVFSVSRISTILKPAVSCGSPLKGKRMTVEFAYADRVLPMDVKVTVDFNDVSCIEFVRSSQTINDAQLNAVAEKAFACAKGARQYDDERLRQIVDDVALNETILILTQALNRDDCESAKAEFISKFEAWRKRRAEENEELERLMGTLFASLASVKVWGKQGASI